MLMMMSSPSRRGGPGRFSAASGLLLLLAVSPRPAGARPFQGQETPPPATAPGTTEKLPTPPVPSPTPGAEKTVPPPPAPGEAPGSEAPPKTGDERPALPPPADASKSEDVPPPQAPESRLGRWSDYIEKEISTAWRSLAQGPAPQAKLTEAVNQIGLDFLKRITGEEQVSLNEADKDLLNSLSLKVVIGKQAAGVPANPSPAPPDKAVPPAPAGDAPAPGGLPGMASPDAGEMAAPPDLSAAPDSPQNAPIRNMIFDQLKKGLTDFQSTLPADSDPAAVRQALEKKAANLVTQFIPPPFGIFREPAEKLMTGLVEELVTKVGNRKKQNEPQADGAPEPAKPEEKVGQDANKDVNIPGEPKRPSDSKIAIEEVNKLRRTLAETDENIRKEKPDTTPDDRKAQLLTELDKKIKLNPKIRDTITEADRKYFAELVNAIVFGKSRLDSIRDEIEKSLDQFDLELVQQGVVKDKDREDGLRKKITDWLKDKKKIAYDDLPPLDKEQIEKQIGEAMDKQFKVAGGTPEKPQTTATLGGLTLPWNLITPQVTPMTTGVPLFVRPAGFHPFHHHLWKQGTGYYLFR